MTSESRRGGKGIESCVRLSPHYYHEEAEIDEIVAQVAGLRRAGPP